MQVWCRAALAAALLAAGPALAQQAPRANSKLQVGSFEVEMYTNYFTHADQSSARLNPRSGERGELLWRCADGGGLWVGVTLSGVAHRDKVRPVEWRFDDDAPARAALHSETGFQRWFLPDQDVAPFTQRAKRGRRLTIRVPDDGAEYVYDLSSPREALERLACARGTPVAGRIPGPTPAWSGVGIAQGSATEVPPRLSNRRQFAEMVRQNLPPELRTPGIRGRVVLHLRVFADGGVDAASVAVTSSTHPAVNEIILRLVPQMVMIPGHSNGLPVPRWVDLPIDFSSDPAPADSAATAARPQR
jgi:TonB family protein